MKDKDANLNLIYQLVQFNFINDFFSVDNENIVKNH